MANVRKVASDNSDIVNFILDNNFQNLGYDDKLFVTQLPRPCPRLENLVIKNSSPNRNDSNRAFSNSWYEKCQWFAGSEIQNKLFCWSCLLFSQNRNNPWTKSGYDNLKELYRSIKKHEISKDHTYAALKFKLFGKQNIQNSLDLAHRESVKKHNDTVKENRGILKRLIDITIFLATQELAFRGHNETETSLNQGNFKELALLLSTYDSTFKHFLDESSVFTGLSKTIQNELIESINYVILENINTELKNAICCSWQVDETTDISCFSQLSVIFRYTCRGNVVERFLGFFNVSEGRKADDLFKLLIKEFEKFDLKNKLIGQTYDGASVMSGDLNGLQAKIKTVTPQALFTHCYAHRLNLILQDAAGKIKECRIFFASLSGISAFFTKSTKRTKVLDEICNKRMPRNAETQWNFKSRLISTVLSHKDELIEVFDTILNSSDFERDHDSIREAVGFKRFLNDFLFLFLLRTFNLIFQQTDVIFSIIQSKFVDIVYSKRRIESYRSEVTYFEEIYCDVTCVLGPPAKKRKTDFDDLNDDNSIYFKRLFNEILYLVVNQIEIRFSNLEALKTFDLLDKRKFVDFKKQFPKDLLQLLIENYPNLFEKVKLENQLRVLYSDGDILGESQNLSDMYNFIYQNGLQNDVSELYKLCSLVLALPATSASVERSFSTLKRIKNFARNTISQSRLSNLSLIAIERTLIKELREDSKFYDQIINHFALGKNRRIDLIYKTL